MLHHHSRSHTLIPTQQRETCKLESLLCNNWHQRRDRRDPKMKGDTELVAVNTSARRSRRSNWRILVAFSFLLVLTHLIFTSDSRAYFKSVQESSELKAKQRAVLDRCLYTRTPAGPPPDFSKRARSDRFVPGTNPVLLKNAKIWTGERNGSEVIFGDILLEKGLIRAFGYIPQSLLDSAGSDLEVHDVRSAWVTPGIVDLHSHMGVSSLPNLKGAPRCLPCPRRLINQSIRYRGVRR
jgi:hypothetical protein